MKKGAKGKKKLQSKVSKKNDSSKNIFNSPLFWIIIAILMIAVAVAIINIQTEPQLAPGDESEVTVGDAAINNLANSIRDLASQIPGLSGVDDEDNLGFAKFLFFLLVLIITFGVALEFPFLGEGNIHNFLAFSIAVVVSLLSTLYLDPEYIKTILLSYNALGITLTSILPFIFVAFLAIKLQGTEYAFFSKVIWIVFAIVLITVWWSAGEDSIGGFWWAYPATLVAIILMMIFERPIFKMVIKDKLEAAEIKIAEKFGYDEARVKASARSAERLAFDESGVA